MRIKHLSLKNFRCFERLELDLESDLTVLFAENGGGKTALLTSIAMGFALLQPRAPKGLKLLAERDARRVRTGEQWQSVGPCSISCTAAIRQPRVASIPAGEQPPTAVTWSATVSPTSRKRKIQIDEATDAIERLRQPGTRWPLLAFYGVNRLLKAPGRKAASFNDRFDGYQGSLEPSSSDGPLLAWLRTQAFADFTRLRAKEEAIKNKQPVKPENEPGGLDLAVYAAMQRATPGVARIEFQPAFDAPGVRFDDGRQVAWAELSDGYHTFMGLIGDIARRAVILNDADGIHAPELIEGVVLIDEIDLHLHPRWQRAALDGLRAAFPRLQIVATTHSPQVLSSALNRQVRRLVGWVPQSDDLHVQGRDTNSILTELMGTKARDEAGEEALEALYAAIAGRRFEEAERLLSDLRERWGDIDREVLRATDYLEDEVAE